MGFQWCEKMDIIDMDGSQSSWSSIATFDTRMMTLIVMGRVQRSLAQVGRLKTLILRMRGMTCRSLAWWIKYKDRIRPLDSHSITTTAFGSIVHPLLSSNQWSSQQQQYIVLYSFADLPLADDCHQSHHPLNCILLYLYMTSVLLQTHNSINHLTPLHTLVQQRHNRRERRQWWWDGVGTVGY